MAHIADSVLARILNAKAMIEGEAPPEREVAPEVAPEGLVPAREFFADGPSTEELGQQIEANMSQAVDAPPDTGQAAEILAGETPLNVQLGSVGGTIGQVGGGIGGGIGAGIGEGVGGALLPDEPQAPIGTFGPGRF